MNGDRWSRIEHLYSRAAAVDPAERKAFLARECGDDYEMLAELESLFAEDEDGFLEEPAFVVAAQLIADDLPVLTGRLVGQYRIAELLGTGGMGDVYRAHDTILARDVAIKILPEAFSNDADRLARFKQEAQFLASLSHPNVAVIYGVHESDGVRGLVLELVDGETLAQRIHRGPLPLFEAMRIAHQVGEGLDAAHQRGIVHRDLKPSNIKIASDGTVKILDFGLAKSTVNDDDLASTDAGPEKRIMGTASYMSPEQARGDAVDKRTDIWAFGCLCFEMLTGRPAFRGKPVGSQRPSESTPDWRFVPSTVPNGVTTLLKRCLDEDPRKRRRDIGDVLMDLDSALAADEAPRPNPRPYRWFVPIAVLVAAVAGAIAVSRTLRPADQSQSFPTEARLSLLLPPGMDFSDQANQIAVSPDGSMVAYVARSGAEAPRLLIRKLAAASEQFVDDALDVRDPFFSPDSRWVGFIAGDTIRKVSLLDGHAQVICSAPRAESPSWTDGFIVFGVTGDLATAGVRRVPEDGGPVEVLSRPASGEILHQSPQILPDGHSVMYSVRKSYPGDSGLYRLVVQSPGFPVRVLLDDAAFGRYMGNSVLIYQRGRSLFATTVDLQSFTVSGPGVMLFNDLPPSVRPLWAAGGGVLAYQPRNENLRFVWVGRDGHEVSLPSPPRAYAAPSLSPQGDRVAVEIAEEGNRFDVWTLDIDQQSLTRVTNNGASRYPLWTPDGARIGVVHRGNYSLYWQTPDGTRSGEMIRGEFPAWIGSWTNDMSMLVYMQESPITQSDLWVVDLQKKTPPTPLVQTPAREYGGRLSPDGRWFAYFSDKSGQFELYLAPFPGAEISYQVSGGGTRAQPREAVWARSGRELFYRQGSQMLSVPVPAGGKPPGHATVLFENDYFAAGGPGIVNYDVSPDDKRFLMLKPLEDRTPHLTVVQGLARLIRERLQSGTR